MAKKTSYKLSTTVSRKTVAKNTNKKESSVNKAKQAKVIPVSTNKSKQVKKPMEKKPNKSVKLQKKILPTKTSIAKKPVKVEKQSVKKNVNTKKVVAVKPKISPKKQQPQIPITTTTTKIKHDPIEKLTEEQILFHEFKQQKREKNETSTKENIAKAQAIRIKFATNYVALCESIGDPAVSTELENLKKCYIGLNIIHEKPNGNYTIYEELIMNLKPTLQRIAKLFNIKPADIFQQVRKVFTEQFNVTVAYRYCDYLVTSVPPFVQGEARYLRENGLVDSALPPFTLKNIHRTETLEKYESFIRQTHKVTMPNVLKDLYDTSNIVKNWRLLHPDFENNNAELNMLSIVLLNIYLLGFYKT